MVNIGKRIKKNSVGIYFSSSHSKVKSFIFTSNLRAPFTSQYIFTSCGSRFDRLLPSSYSLSLATTHSKVTPFQLLLVNRRDLSVKFKAF
jgi:hypothetical protein